MVRKTKDEAAATRRALLSAALVVFSQKGYEAARLEDVARQAGVSRGAIYWHFHSKAELYNTLVEETVDQAHAVVKRAVSEGRSFLDTQRRIMVALLILLEGDVTYRAIQELSVLKTGFAPELEEGLRRKQQALRELETQIAGYFQQGIALGEVRADLDPLIGARSMLAYLNGITVTWLLDQQAFSLREQAEPLVDAYIRGIAARP